MSGSTLRFKVVPTAADRWEWQLRREDDSLAARSPNSFTTPREAVRDLDTFRHLVVSAPRVLLNQDGLPVSTGEHHAT